MDQNQGHKAQENPWMGGHPISKGVSVFTHPSHCSLVDYTASHAHLLLFPPRPKPEQILVWDQPHLPPSLAPGRTSRAAGPGPRQSL